jgi:hypothetical protein
MLPEKDREIRRVGPVHAGFVAVLDVHLGNGFWCNHVELRRVRRHGEADATYGWEYAGRPRIVPRVRVSITRLNRVINPGRVDNPVWRACQQH